MAQLRDIPDYILSSPNRSYEYASNDIKRHDRRLLESVCSDAKYAYLYAKDIKGHDDRLLNATLLNPQYSYLYALEVLKCHDERLLNAICSDPAYSYFYAVNVLKQDDERLRHAVSVSPEFSFKYAYKISGHDKKLFESAYKMKYWREKYQTLILDKENCIDSLNQEKNQETTFVHSKEIYDKTVDILNNYNERLLDAILSDPNRTSNLSRNANPSIDNKFVGINNSRYHQSKDNFNLAYDGRTSIRSTPHTNTDRTIKISRDMLHSQDNLVINKILADPERSYQYAFEVLKNHDEKFLNAVLISPQYAYLYAQNILRSHHEKLLEATLSDPQFSYNYAFNILKRHDNRIFNSVIKSPEYSFKYAKNILHFQGQLFSEVPIYDPSSNAVLSEVILQKYFEEIFETVSTDAFWSFKFASEIIKGHNAQLLASIKEKEFVLLQYMKFLNTITFYPRILIDLWTILNIQNQQLNVEIEQNFILYINRHRTQIFNMLENFTPSLKEYIKHIF